MADEEKTEETPGEEAPKKSRLPLILGLVLAIAGGGGGFFAVQSGMLFAPETEADEEAEDVAEAKPLPAVAFVAVNPLVINLESAARAQHMRFVAQLEVEPEYQVEVEGLMPRVVDVLNSYLRAVSTEDLEDPSSLVELRAQMLRRVQLVTGEGRVRDLLVMEFVVN